MERLVQVDRGIGWLIAVSSLPLSVWWLPAAVEQAHLFPWWWNAGSWLVVGLFATMAGLGAWLPIGVLRRLWILTPTLLIALQLFSFGALTDAAVSVLPWVRLLEPAAVCLLVLTLSPLPAVAASLVSSVSVLVSAWVFTGGVPQLVLSSLPPRLSNVVFVALVIGIRHRLIRPHQAEAEARAAAERRARSTAEAEEQARLSRFIHDEVLSVLSAAQYFTGPPPTELRAEASATIRALSEGRATGRLGCRRVDAVQVAADLRTRLLRIAPGASVTIEADDVAVAADPIEVLGDAAAEAVRNAVRHAHARRIVVNGQIHGHLMELSVRDDGIGFDPASIPPERWGVRQSIVRRMEDAGGRAEIRSERGAASASGVVMASGVGMAAGDRTASGVGTASGATPFAPATAAGTVLVTDRVLATGADSACATGTALGTDVASATETRPGTEVRLSWVP